MFFIDLANFSRDDVLNIAYSNKLLTHIHRGMMLRCYSEQNGAYHNYGGRGIQVCDAWHDYGTWYEEFGRFRPSTEHSMDRIDNDGNYCLENCRWATAQTQASNTRDTISLDFMQSDDEMSDVSILSEELDIDASTIRARHNSYDPLIHGPSLEAHLKKPLGVVEKRRGAEVVVNGQTFISKAEAARHFGVARGTWKSRVAKGMSFEESMLLPPDTTKIPNQLEVSGKVFKSITECAAYYGINQTTLGLRIRKGMPLEEAVKGRNNQTRKLVVEGKEWPSMAAACRHYEKSKGTVEKRLKRGLSPDDAFLT